MGRISPFRITLWDMASGTRGPGSVVAIVDDAREIGVSEWANDGGEMFCTLSQNHPQIAQFVPKARHYRVEKIVYENGAYAAHVVGEGLLDDYQADENEAVFYGIDYMSVLDTQIDNTLYTYNNVIAGSSSTVGTTFFRNEFGIATNSASTDEHAAGENRLGFVTIGNVESDTTTIKALPIAYSTRLHLLQQGLGIVQQGLTTRPQVYFSRTWPKTINYAKNRGSVLTSPRLEYGVLVNGFDYIPFGEYGNMIRAIGQKRDGATVLYSSQSAISSSFVSYGQIVKARLFVDLLNQTDLDNRTKAEARKLSREGKQVGLVLRTNGLHPWDGYDLLDAFRVKIRRGIVNIESDWTLWGQEWIGHADGSDELFLSLLPRDT